MAVGALLAQQTDTVTFKDEFTPNPSPLWSNSSGNWAASGGQYSAQVPNNNPATYTGLPFLLTDYTLTVTTLVGDGGIWLRGNEDASCGNGGNCILLVLGGNGYGNGARGGNAGTAVYFSTLGQSKINEVDGVFTPGNTYTVTVTAKSNTFSVYINGSKTAVTTFTTSILPSGQLGLYDDQPNVVTGQGFGTPTTFSKFSLTGTAVPPRISSFSPVDGKVGSQVTITGINLQNATSVTFNGTPAQFTQEYPSTNIVATVPAAATTGPVEVITPLGPSSSFTVLP